MQLKKDKLFILEQSKVKGTVVNLEMMSYIKGC